MSYITSNIRRSWLLFLLAFLCLLLQGCASPKEPVPSADQELRDNTPVVLTAEYPGETVLAGDVVSIDCSCTSSGYISLEYSGTNEKVKFQIRTPQHITYTYLVTPADTPLVYPLTGGTGTYTLTLLESVDIEEDLYAIVFQEDTEVTICDEFLPYLTPNVYTQFSPSCACVAKGKELAAECYSDLEVIERIYYYVTENITYDEEKAQTIAYGYIPDPNDTLAANTGICFDYASLMTAMLRSQRIPTRLEVGYAGEVYHAWISCYVEEIGWIDNIIEFDGEHWSLMDPTLAANNSSKAVKEYIGNGSKYLVKYTY